MDAIQRLLRRKERRDVRRVVLTVDSQVLSEVRGLMKEEGHTCSLLFDVFLRGYAARHPAVLALIDQIKREREAPGKDPKGATFSRRETDEIFELIEGEKQ